MDLRFPTYSETEPFGNPFLTKIEGLNEEDVRKELPVPRDPYLSLGDITNLAKFAIGKDLSKFSFPVFINEPFTILHKVGEFMAFTDLLTHASKQPDPYVRMAYVLAETMAQQWLVLNRTKKPFISLIGETFEIVTDKFKFYGENVS